VALNGHGGNEKAPILISGRILSQDDGRVKKIVGKLNRRMAASPNCFKFTLTSKRTIDNLLLSIFDLRTSKQRFNIVCSG
jgi:hypothetical protein